MAVMATVLTISSTVVPRDKSFTGLFRPCSTGPTATAPADCCTALSVLLPVLRSGKINTDALPATSDSGIFEAATDAETAASYCSGPSTLNCGLAALTRLVASRTLSTASPEPESPVEYDSMATRGSTPNCCAVCADAAAISASCSALGSVLTAQSP